MPAAPPAEAVAPLMRGIAVLRELTDAGGRMDLSDLVRATGLARSTVDRIAATLARMGYVRLQGHEARLAPRLMELGNAYLASLGLPGRLGPLAERLAEELDESVSLAVPDRDGIRFVHQTTRRRAMSLTFRIGDLLPYERTAAGAVFATTWTDEEWAARRGRDASAGDTGRAAHGAHGAHADDAFRQRTARAREAGWAVDDQLMEPGLVAVAMPVRDPQGAVVCAVSVVSHTSRHTARSLGEAVLPRLRETVAAMEAELARPRPAGERPVPSGLAHWTTASKRELGAGFVESLARGLTVVTAFGEGRAELPSPPSPRPPAWPAPPPDARSSPWSTSATSPHGSASSGSPPASSPSAAPRSPGRRSPTSPYRTWRNWSAGSTTPPPSRSSTATTSATRRASPPSGS